PPAPAYGTKLGPIMTFPADAPFLRSTGRPPTLVSAHAPHAAIVAALLIVRLFVPAPKFTSEPPVSLNTEPPATVTSPPPLIESVLPFVRPTRWPVRLKKLPPVTFTSEPFATVS